MSATNRRSTRVFPFLQFLKRFRQTRGQHLNRLPPTNAADDDVTSTARNPLTGLQAVVADAMRAAGVPARRAVLAASQAVRSWCANFGGVNVYLPRGREEQIAERDARIAEAFDGTNAVELARCYGLSESRVRQIIRRLRRAGAETRVVAARGRPGRRKRISSEIG